MIISFINRCRFALLGHRTGLIARFLWFNGKAVCWTFLTVSVCCPDIQAFQIKRFSEPLYCTADLTVAFYGSIIMRLRLPLTVSVFPVSRYRLSEVPMRKYPIAYPLGKIIDFSRIPSTVTDRSSLGYLITMKRSW